MTQAATPKAAGFAMPPEWAPHRRCWMSWPCRESGWAGRMDAAQAAYERVAKTIGEFEPVSMLCRPTDVAEASLALRGVVDVLPMPISDSWLRDNGPSFVLDGDKTPAIVDWRFDAWGGLYADFGPDDAVPARLAERLSLRRFAAPIVMEGGAFHVDGDGTVLVTEECLLEGGRNPDLDREAIAGHLCDFLGAEAVIWLGRGYDGDETRGHVDEVAAFARPGLILANAQDDTDDPNCAIFRDNLARLGASRDARGRALDVVTLPVPPARPHPSGRGRMTLSYTNFYLPNGGVVMPSFETAEDDRAYRILREVFDDRDVVQVPALDIVIGGGGIHCITQQQPISAADD